MTWRHDHQQLRVRVIDVRDLVPHDEWDQLVTANPKVMGGAPVFADSRVSIEIVLSSLEAELDLEELKLSYPFMTLADYPLRRVSILEQQVRSGPVDITTSGQNHGDPELLCEDVQHISYP